MNINQVDESRLAALMKGASPDNFFKSGVYGVLAIFLHFLGYAAIAAYVYQHQQTLGEILFLVAAMFAVLGAGHHISLLTGIPSISHRFPLD